MSKISNIEEQIPALYRRTALTLTMFAFVRGVRATLHTVTIKEAIEMYAENFGIKDYNVESFATIYGRMQKELININKKR